MKAGVTPLEDIQAATIVRARVMNLESELGTIEQGKRADLVLINGNPLASISHIRKVSRVVSHEEPKGAISPLMGSDPCNRVGVLLHYLEHFAGKLLCSRWTQKGNP